MKNKFIFPSGVDFIRSELKEESLVHDYYSFVDTTNYFSDSFFSNNKIKLDINNIDKVGINKVYTMALNNARNIKTNLSINSAKIKT